MPFGIITNFCAIMLGGFLGSRFGKHLPHRIGESLSSMFGIVCMAIGITLTVRLHSLPAVVLALTLGGLIGEGLRLESRIRNGCERLKGIVEKRTGHTGEADDAWLERFVSLLILFCTGSTGLMGAMTEGMTGDNSILLAKAIMDFFTAGIFASTMGVMVMLIAIPQIIIFLALFFFAEMIMLIASPQMIADFMGVGGLIALATAFRILEIKSMRVSNFLPALIIVMPVSQFWTMLFG